MKEMPASAVAILFVGVMLLVVLTVLVNPMFFFSILVFTALMIVVGLVKGWL